MVGLVAGTVLPLQADVILPSIFSDHAVLQKSPKVPVWGKADPDEKVTVTLDGEKAEATTGQDGKWRVNLNLATKAQGPFELVVEGKNKITVADVLVGEVWLCSGQSNMEWIVVNTLGGETEIANSANPLLRQFLVKKATSVTPLDACEGTWTLAGPETTGKFTAVGYFFGKKLQNTLKVPVGLVHTSWGGTPSEAWTSIEALRTFDALQQSIDQKLSDEATFPQRLRDFLAKYSEWEEANARADKPSVTANAAPDTPTVDWKKVNLPADGDKLADAAGALWIRRTMTLGPELAGKTLRIDLPVLSDYDTVYWNGQKIGATLPTTPEAGSVSSRQYSVPPSLVKEGDNTLAIRIFNPNSKPSLASADNFRAGPVTLAGEWLAKVEYTFPKPLSTEAQAAYPVQPAKLGGLQYYPAHLFNAMLNPLIPYAMQGAVWYQGEANVGRAYQYRTAFPLMIKDWRSRWGQGDFPFYWCQLANFTPKKNVPGESAWAELREAQSMALSLPNSGQANLIDIGEEGDIHPRNKKDVGDRLALIALAKDYGQKIECSGPVYKSMNVEGDKIRVAFTHADNGLVVKPLGDTYLVKSLNNETKPLVRNSPNSELEGFAICGGDRHWKWANAKIENETVVVSSPEVAKPVAVRYAWANNPTCNLYNKAGLPAVPFRTDDFPAITFNKKF